MMRSGARDEIRAPMMHAGDRADHQRAGDRERDVAEEQVTEGRGADERHRLHEVGAHELAGRERSGRAAGAAR